MLAKVRQFLTSSLGFLFILFLILALYYFGDRIGPEGITTKYIHIFALSMLFGTLLVPPAIDFAMRIRLIDFPGESRKVHREPVAVAGGIAVTLSIVITLAVTDVPLEKKYKVLLVASCLIFFVGFADDIVNLPARTKFVAQILLALWVVNEGIYIKLLPDELFLGNVANKLLSILWIVGFTNAYNFIDGLDGLAGGIGILIVVFSSLISTQNGHPPSPVSPALAGALAGFLVFNTHPAKVFLGDSGAQLVGFLISSLTADSAWASPGQWAKALFIPGLVMWILLFDILQISILRVKYGFVRSFSDWLAFTGKDHIHHRLMHLGLGHRGAVLTLWILQTALGSLALYLSSKKITQSQYVVLIAVAVLLSFIAVAVLDKLTSKKAFETQ